MIVREKRVDVIGAEGEKRSGRARVIINKDYIINKGYICCRYN